MKPARDLDIATKHGAALRGGEVEPLSKLAARSSEQHADRFAFTDEDQALLDAVLAEDGEEPSA